MSINEKFKSLQDTTSKIELMIIADAIAEEYHVNKDLTAFTEIDIDSFYETLKFIFLSPFLSS
jgi:hypothetical protein